MIAIELANLEFVYSDLLHMILRIDRETAKSVYFTPKSSLARMETLQNVIETVLVDDESLRQQCASLVKRGMRVLNKRNEMLHDVWGISKDDPGQAVRMTFPGGKRTPVKVEMLTDMVRDLRIIADEVMDLFYGLIYRPHYKINVTYKVSPEGGD